MFCSAAIRGDLGVTSVSVTIESSGRVDLYTTFNYNNLITITLSLSQVLFAVAYSMFKIA